MIQGAWLPDVKRWRKPWRSLPSMPPQRPSVETRRGSDPIVRPATPSGLDLSADASTASTRNRPHSFSAGAPLAWLLPESRTNSLEFASTGDLSPSA